LLVAGLTLVVGLLVNPLRLKLQHVVDETLFAARANYRRAVTQITAELHSSLNRDDLFGRVVEAVHRVVPSEMLAAYGVEDGTLALRSFVGTRPIERFNITEDLKRALGERRVLAKRNVVRGELPHVDISREGFLDDCGWSVCVGVAAEGGELLGVLAVSPRLPREHYDEEELNLLLVVGSETAGILERLTLQEKIILAQEEQKKSEDLSALKSYFISSVSHELRMPLTSIRMFAETLRSGKAGSPRRQREYLEIIEGESERLSRLIGNILDFAKIERGVKEYAFTEVRLDEIMRRSVNAMRYQFEKHKGKLKTRVKKGIPVVTADGDALEEAVLNLLSNALKYSTLRKEVSVSLFERHHQVVIEVADKGIGIPESELGNIFDRFYRVRDDRTRQVGGAGLGLALVKHIVDAHHGTLSVKSKVGKGSTFTITLPIRQPKVRKEQ
jgi:signal transduction histidine kinase